MAQRRRPSPCLWRVGSHITAFGACSAFTTRYGLPARGATLWPFPSKAPAISLPPPPLRLLPAGTTSCRVGIAPTEDPRLTTAHIDTRYSHADGRPHSPTPPPCPALQPTPRRRSRPTQRPAAQRRRRPRRPP